MEEKNSRTLIAAGIHDSDEELLIATLAGETTAFGGLVEKYQAALLVMIFRQIGQKEEAEDLLQQVFLKAYQHLRDFRGQSKFFTWLYSIALNHVKNHLRQRKIRRTVSMDDVGVGEDGTGRQWADTRPTPEETVAQNSETQAMVKALEVLEGEQKSIFVMHYFQNLPLPEVAEKLGKPIGTVKVYLHRARKAVRRVLETLKL